MILINVKSRDHKGQTIAFTRRGIMGNTVIEKVKVSTCYRDEIERKITKQTLIEINLIRERKIFIGGTSRLLLFPIDG